MRKLKSRIVSGVLSLAMILSMTPSSVYATDLTMGTDSSTLESTTESVLSDDTAETTTTSLETSTEITTEVETTETITTEATTSEETTTEVTTTEEVTTESTEVTTESTTETTEEESTETIDASTLVYRLIVGTSDSKILTNGTIISSLDDLYIIGYPTEEDRTAGIEYYTTNKADIVEKDDSIFEVADNDNKSEDIDTTQEVINTDDAFSNLDELDVDEKVVKTDKVIAVIDTGISKELLDSKNIINAVSVIGKSVEDDNGHGTRMVNNILANNSNAKILSIKALDNFGKASASDVYAAIQYAIDNKVDYINLSFSAYKLLDTDSVVESIINEAIEKNNITVIGAAGNGNKDTKYYIPGCIEKAYIIGACNNSGRKIDTSNYGTLVDYFVNAGSTSEATSIFTGIISKNSNIAADNITIFNNVDNIDNVTDINEDSSNEDNSKIIWLTPDQYADYYTEEELQEIKKEYEALGVTYNENYTINDISFPDTLSVHYTIYDPYGKMHVYGPSTGTRFNWKAELNTSLPAGITFRQGEAYCADSTLGNPNYGSTGDAIFTKISIDGNTANYIANGIRVDGNDHHQRIVMAVHLQGSGSVYLSIHKGSTGVPYSRYWISYILRRVSDKKC